MKILLVFPTPFETGRLGLENVVWLSEPVALTSIGAMVSRDHEVRVLDLRLEPEDALAKALSGFRPDLVGTTSMTTDAYQAKAVLRMAKRICPAALTVIGGHMPTLSPGEFDEDYVDVIVQGEGEVTFKEIVDRWDAGRDRSMAGIAGTRWRDPSGLRRIEPKRGQTVDLDRLPAPDRRLVKQYRGRYFFTVAKSMASIFTSRGCSYDCNFCAIWEFYERRVRYLSAEKIVDQMEACEEDFVFVLDDNFLVNKKRILAMCDELERRGVKKYWMTQGRTDFVADHPEIMARLAKNGLIGLLSGYESNDDDNLAALRKKSTFDKNKAANRLLNELGICSTGIFMVRPDWTTEQFDSLYDYIRTLDVGIPLVTILTPLPGTQLYRAYKDQLVTTDHRLFDLLHAVLPTRLSRADFYANFARSVDEIRPSTSRAMKNMLRVRPGLVRKLVPGIAWFYARAERYKRVHRDPETFLRDEEGLLNGPGAKDGVDWRDVVYPTAENPEPSRVEAGKRVVPRLWADEIQQLGAK